MKQIFLFIIWMSIILLTQQYGIAASSRNVVLVKQNIQNNYYAILVGVEDSASNNIPDLQYCEDDVNDMFTILTKSGYEPGNITKITGIKATKENILEAVNKLKNRSYYPNPDTILFYFSGHGMAAGKANYLIPVEGTGDNSQARDRNVSMDKVIEKLEKSGFPRRLAVIDACRNNPKGRTTGGTWTKGFNDVREKYKSAKGTKIILSCEFGKKSWDNDSTQNGVFTSFLIKGLESGEAKESDGVVTVGSLEKHLFDKMGEHSRQQGNKEQIPVTMGEGSSMIPFAVVNAVTGKIDGGGTTNGLSTTSGKRLLKGIPVQISGLGEGLTAKYDGLIDIEIEGELTILNTLDSAKIKAVLDVSGYSEGSHAFDLLPKLKCISMPSSIRITSVNPGIILLDIIKDPQRIITRVIQVVIVKYGQNSKYEYFFSDSVCSLTIKGKAQVVENMKEPSQLPQVDVSGYGVGTWDVRVTLGGSWSIYQGYEITDYTPKTVRVTVKR